MPSITSSVSIESTTFEEPPIQRPPQYFVVELKNEPEFDLSEYLSVRGSQSTAAHSQLLSELESQDQRIAVASRHSQGTIPDSQDPSSPGDLDSQRRETQQSLYPSPVVIPDSQDLGRDKSSPDKSSPAKSSLDKTFTRPRTPASGSRDKCTSSHKQVIADSAAVESDIPSHQPDQYHSVESPDLSAEKTDNQGARQDSKSQTFSEASQQAADQSEPKPVFFSQAKFNVAPEVPLSPQGIHTQGKYEASISQDTRPSYQSATGFFRRASEAWDRGKNPPQLEMFAEQGDESKSSERQRQVSAVNQLRSLWDVAPTDGPAPNSEGHSSAAAELAALSASDAQDDRHDPQRTSPAAYFTQPPQQDTPDDQAVGGDPMSSEPATGRQRSAVDSLRDLVNQTFSTPDGPSPEALMPPPSFTMQQGTVSPRDVSKPVEAEKTTLALLPSLSEGMSENFGSSGNSITMGQVAPTHDESSESSDEEPTQADHVITLPFQASIRDLYYETLLKYKEDVVKFGAVFADEIYEPPDESLVKTINELFNRLQNLCNYPEDIVGTSIQTLPSNKKVKYSLDANAKFNFLFELLQGIQKDTAVLIVAGSTNLLRPLVELVESLKLDCTCDAIGHAAKDAFRLSAVRVTLCLPDTVDPSRFDVIVGYDSAFNHSAMSTDLAANGSGTPARNQPLVLRLTAAFSIEQIDLEMPNTSDELERMDALLVGVTAARRLIRNPPQMHEPHEIAKLFVDYVNGETDSLLWEPDQLPDDVLDVYFNSQSMSQRPQATPSDAENGRKRKLVGCIVSCAREDR